MSGTLQAVAAPETKRCAGGRMERKKNLMAERRALFNRLFFRSCRGLRRFMGKYPEVHGGALLGARGSRPLQTVEGNGGRKILSRCSEEPSKLRRPGGLRSQVKAAGRTGGYVLLRSLMVGVLLGARGSRPLQTLAGNGRRENPLSLFWGTVQITKAGRPSFPG